MGLPLFVAPPSPSAKNASINNEKAVAQNRSTIRRQRTVRGTPHWALSEPRESSHAVRRAGITAVENEDAEIEIEAMRAAANAIRAETSARRRNENRPTLRDSLSFERRMNHHDSYVPPAPAAPSTSSSWMMRSEPPRMFGEGPTYLAPPTRRSPEHRRSIHDPLLRESVSRSTSPPLPSYTPGFSPAHIATSDVRTSLRRESPERTSARPTVPDVIRNRLSARSRRSNDTYHASRATRGTRMSELLAQRSRRIRAREGPNGPNDLSGGLGDRDRSISPETPADWDTLSVTLTPDPQAPSTANSSFASANASTNPSTAIASAASSTSDSQSSATSASETSRALPPYRINDRFRLPPISGTRSIPDFSIPYEAADRRLRAQSPLPPLDAALDVNCDSSDELGEPDENTRSTNVNESANNEENRSESDHEDNADEEDLYELDQSEYTRTHSFWLNVANPEPRRQTLEMAYGMDTTSGQPLRRDTRTHAQRMPHWARDQINRQEPYRNQGHPSMILEHGFFPSVNLIEDNEAAARAETDFDGESNSLGGMQRIVRRLAERRDIPDTWWAGAGLSRVAGGGVVRGEDGVEG